MRNGWLGTIGLFVALPAAAQVSEARQIEWAVAAAPEAMRADATVLGYRDGKLVTLRSGTGLLVCLADDPAKPDHHVSCYHKELEPFMRRGRELREKGLDANAIERTRLDEIKSGKLEFPKQPTSLYQLIAPAGHANAETGVVTDAKSMYVVYVPYATPETTGLSVKPLPHGPWLMYPGRPDAHLMIIP
jgi:hypothetical protein